MRHRIRSAGNYLLFILISNAFYGTVLYLTVTWLARHSLLYAYVGNVALIVLGLAIDEILLRRVATPEAMARQLDTIKSDRDRATVDRANRWFMRHFVSFRASLYLFYLVILILSQVVRFSPGLIGDQLATFVQATDYSILLLVASDDFMGRFSADRRRMRRAAEQYDSVRGGS